MNVHDPLNPPNPPNPHTLRIVLVLQGACALGAYQALHQHELGPDRIVGASIGAMRRRWLRKIQRSESAIT